MNSYTISFQDREVTYSTESITCLEYVQNLINSGMIEAQKGRFSLPCKSQTFEYMIKTISKETFTVVWGTELIIDLINLTDYIGHLSFRRQIIDVIINSFPCEDAKKLVSIVPSFFIIPKDNLVCLFVRSHLDDFLPVIHELSKHEMIDLCEIVQHCELSRIVRLLHKWEQHNENSSIWEEISKYRYSLISATFSNIVELDNNLLLQPYIVTYLKNISFNRCVYGEQYYSPFTYEWNKKRETSTYDFNITFTDKSAIITVTTDLYNITITSEERQEFYHIDCLRKGEKFQYFNVIPGQYYYISYTGENKTKV